MNTSFFYHLVLFLSCLQWLTAQEVAQPIKQFLKTPPMQGASFSLLIQDVETGTVVFAYDTIRQAPGSSGRGYWGRNGTMMSVKMNFVL